MAMWQFDDESGSSGSSSTVANSSDSVTYNISSASTIDTGIYYCVATIDGMEFMSDMYTLFGKTPRIVLLCMHTALHTCIHFFSIAV